MNLHPLIQQPGSSTDAKLVEAYIQLESYLSELRKRELTENVTELINREIEEVNTTSLRGVELRRLIKKIQDKLVKLVEKEMKLVPINYYRSMWMALGMSAFGIPMGIVFGMSLDNMAFLAIGIPIGLAIGTGVGTGLDNKAAEEGRQLNVELK